MQIQPFFRRLAGVVAALCLTATALPIAQAQDRSYILTTATTGGTYYPVGVALASIQSDVGQSEVDRHPRG